MPGCASCKNKRTDERCTNSALNGLLFCGIHSRTKKPRLWAQVNGLDTKIIQIQKLWKGYFIRKRLRLAGPGVLKRSLCNNQDELISLEPISTVDPFNYFGFEEHGKVYGFDIRTVIDALYRTGNNPFTRQPFSMESRKRLRESYGFRLRRRLENYYEHNILRTPDLLLQNRWTQVCQMIEENGFYNIHQNIFLGLNKSQLYVFLNMIHTDMQAWASEHNPVHSKRFRYLVWIKNGIKKFNQPNDIQYHSFTVASLLCILLYDCVDSYNVCFIIMSALYRL
jgi:hypothetical protein